MTPKISIIINNHNYGLFINRAIESALAQTVNSHEVIVVDDGSTDDSLQKIESYRGRVKIISKNNGGQASAFNAGFEASSGDWIWFLDSDDMLERQALERVSKFFSGEIAKIHAPLKAMDRRGALLNFEIPSKPLSDGNVLPEIIKEGGYSWPPTSGNVFPRWVLEKCMPIPEKEYRLCADLYICSYAAMFGKIQAINEPTAYYRIHGSNHFHGFRMDANWLERQGRNLITGVALIEELVRTYVDSRGFVYPFSRRNVEMLMIAYRFSPLQSTKALQRNVLQKNWWNSTEVKNLRGIRKYIGVAFWLIISYAPKPIAKLAISMRQRKAQKFNQSEQAIGQR